MSEEIYEEGYKTGRNWKDSYLPGGPYACDDESRKRKAIWLEGFHDGLEVNRYKSTPAIRALLAPTPEKEEAND